MLTIAQFLGTLTALMLDPVIFVAGATLAIIPGWWVRALGALVFVLALTIIIAQRNADWSGGAYQISGLVVTCRYLATMSYTVLVVLLISAFKRNAKDD